MFRGVVLLSDLLFPAVARIYPSARACTRLLGIRASAHPHLTALVEVVTDPFERVEAFDRGFAIAPDQWRYTTNPIEHERHQLALDLLDAVRGGTRFGRVLEIACAEGVFTEMLAPRCDSLLAVDFSRIALERAHERCEKASHVTFRHWNLRTDPIPGHFDLLVVMDVLTSIRRADRLRKILEKLVAGMRSGDLLLAGDYREQKELRWLEDSRLGRILLFGGKWVIEALASHPALDTLKRGSTDSHVFALLRKL